ncbi:DNA mismatch repair endonuclease MutL [Mesorhizobium sp. RP14(2022)]|uniref:DNA mismatch repair protein MutL n=1 Tax=Mesorhizobium liriopis TaxID=2953882 RepID=A0ABT1C0X9_9HYPH|nr:DNA mismatch repair endonuclease MutL [Mesorhizobium liriopis]MCO6048469.1 DNA mismatch repair endonuclease MutL [Mesorhizobium liriopis]
MPIRLLSETTINQIAAGEVVERPASVVKELVENALDAGATRVEIATAGGGLGLVRVSDNGGGIPPTELPLAVSRHCTSKIETSASLDDIRTLGFRGEALPSIGAVARLSLRSRQPGAAEGAEILVEGGAVSGVMPAPANPGTVVEVRDLFFATPARLKFAKGERAESSAITDAVRRIAVAFPQVRFTLSGTDRQTLDFLPQAADENGQLARVAQALGAEFKENAVPLDAVREGVRLSGHVSIPSFNRANALQQYFFVNGRPVRDRQLASALRAAYADLLPRDRHPLAALFVSIDGRDVDVNVHPAKADVRFRDPGLVRGLLIGGVREALAQAGIRPATSGAQAMQQAFRPGGMSGGASNGLGAYRPQPASYSSPTYASSPAASPYRPLDLGMAESSQARFATAPAADVRAEAEVPAAAFTSPLGAARAQVHDNYIVAQTEDSLIIVDQHAAHERLVYEALKDGLDKHALPTQMLLLPEIVDLPEEDVDRLIAHADEFQRMGLSLARFGPGAVEVRETPSMLGEIDAARLVRDLADELADGEASSALRDQLHRVASTMACHGSVRSGRRLKPDEMNALLRQMEAVPGSGTCNHGRPTYIELKLHDIERLFGRR